MKLINHKSSLRVSGIMMLLIIILPFLQPDSDKMVSITVAAFSIAHPAYSYLVTCIFFFFGANSIISGWRLFDGLAFNRLMLLTFGCTFAAGAFFTHLGVYESLSEGLPLSAFHRYFACVSVISFSALAVSTAVIQSENRGRLISFSAGAASVLGAIIQSESAAYAGLWQRTILLTMAGWMVYISRYSEFRTDYHKPVN